MSLGASQMEGCQEAASDAASSAELPYRGSSPEVKLREPEPPGDLGNGMRDTDTGGARAEGVSGRPPGPLERRLPPSRCRALWRQAILAVRVWNAQVKKNVLTMKLSMAEAKAEEAEKRAVDLEQELARVAGQGWERAKQEKVEFLAMFEKDQARLEQAHKDMVQATQTVQSPIDMSAASSVRGLLGLVKDMSVHLEAQGEHIRELQAGKGELERLLAQAKTDEDDEVEQMREEVAVLRLSVKHLESASFGWWGGLNHSTCGSRACGTRGDSHSTYSPDHRPTSWLKLWEPVTPAAEATAVAMAVTEVAASG